MVERNPKVYVVNAYSNRISLRSLTVFERRNRTVFELSRSVHDSWEAAHAALVAEQEKKLKKARKALESSERALAKAKAMTQEGVL
jgi:hypothetical protein